VQIHHLKLMENCCGNATPSLELHIHRTPSPNVDNNHMYIHWSQISITFENIDSWHIGYTWSTQNQTRSRSYTLAMKDTQESAILHMPTVCIEQLSQRKINQLTIDPHKRKYMPMGSMEQLWRRKCNPLEMDPPPHTLTYAYIQTLPPKLL